MSSRWRSHVHRLVTHWAFWPLVLALVLRVVAIGWGLPASDGWDNDGVAPRDVFPGLAATFTPGEYYTYPPLHLILLAVLSSPVALAGVLAAPSHHLADVVRTLLAPGYMTWISGIARGVALVLSLATTWLVADLARRTCGLRAGTWAAWAGAVNLGLTYYGKTSNLDAPSVFWTALALWLLAKDGLVPTPRTKLWAALAATAAVLTKDQAYANFVLVVPVAVLASLALSHEAWPRRVWPWLVALAGAVVAYALVSGLVVNPRGFAARVAFLRGSASQDFVLYSADWNGRRAALEGVIGEISNLIGTGLMGFAGIGLLAVLVQRVSARRRVARLLPGLAIVSFTLFFNCVARRSEDRFVLPQSALCAFYVGLGVAWLDTRLRGQLALPVRFVAPMWLVPALYRSLSLDHGMLDDPRYQVEQWLAEHASHEARIETYGLNVYLPRFAAGQPVTRVSPPDAPMKSPLSGIEERIDELARVAERNPDYLVVPLGYTWRYLARDPHERGEVLSHAVQRFAESDGARYFAQLFGEQLGYQRVFEARCDETHFQRLWMHASLCEPVFVYARRTP